MTDIYFTVAVFRNEDWIKGFDFKSEHDANRCYNELIDSLDQLGQMDGEEISDMDGCYQFDCYLPTPPRMSTCELLGLSGIARGFCNVSVVFIPPRV